MKCWLNNCNSLKLLKHWHKQSRTFTFQMCYFLCRLTCLGQLSGGSWTGQTVPWTASWTWAGSWSSKPSWATTSGASLSTMKTSHMMSLSWWCSESSGASSRVTMKLPSNIRMRVRQSKGQLLNIGHYQLLTNDIQCEKVDIGRWK